MRVLGILFLALVVLSSLSHGQARFAGKVVEVIDGRTLVIETSAGKITAQLQYIETPEREQQLHSVVRDHLASLAIGKVVEFRPLRLDGKVTIGRVEIGGVDLGLQLVRNGAAWHEPVESSGQSANEANDYAENQLSAKVEKRGVWSIQNLKTPWQVRAEKQAELDRIERKKQDSRLVPFAVNQFQTANRRPVSRTVTGNARGPKQPQKNYDYPEANADMWVEVGGAYLSQAKALGKGTFYGYDQNRKIENVSTNGVLLPLYKDKVSVGDIELRFVYFYQESRYSTGQTAYVLGLRAKSASHLFDDDPRMRFVIDGHDIDLGIGSRHWRSDETATEELLQFKVTREDYTKLALGNSSLLKIGNYSATLSPECSKNLRELLDVSKNGKIFAR